MLPRFPFYLTFLILLSIMWLRYFLLAGAFYFLGPSIRNWAQNLHDIKYSVLSSMIFALSGTCLIELWHRGYTGIYLDPEAFGTFYLILSLPFLMLVHDTYFYWTHRLLHHGALFKRFHLAHHRSHIPSAWTSFSFHPAEAIIQALILPALVIVFPVHWLVLFIFLFLMTLFGLLNHLGHELYPAFMEKKLGLINASHHAHHHQKMHLNFGLYFTFWDHFMGTEGKR